MVNGYFSFERNMSAWARRVQFCWREELVYRHKYYSGCSVGLWRLVIALSCCFSISISFPPPSTVSAADQRVVRILVCVFAWHITFISNFIHIIHSYLYLFYISWTAERHRLVLTKWNEKNEWTVGQTECVCVCVEGKSSISMPSLLLVAVAIAVTVVDTHLTTVHCTMYLHIYIC